MSILRIALIVAGTLLLLIIGVFYVALAPTIRNLSKEPVFRQWVNTPLALQRSGQIYIYPKGHYSFYPQVLTQQRAGIAYQLKYNLPAGTIITIRSFKTYKNNAGSGSTTLYALGDFSDKDGKKIPFEYAWTYEERTGLYEDMDIMPLAIWQKEGEETVKNDF
jgi:hypothetical protein